MPYEAITLQMPEDLDFFLQIDAGWHFATRPHARVTALLETDPHCISASHYAVPKSQSDFTFTMQTPYMRAGEHYLPYAYAPDIHYQEPETEKIYDVCLIGLHYNSRNALISALQAKGLRVYYNIGDVFDEYRYIYNQSKIALSWSSLDDLCARNWEALAMGNLLVCNRVTDMQTFFSEDEHYLGFSSIDEAVEKVTWALENPELSQRIADAGHRKVMPHTYDKRCAQILRTCGLR
jgi:spore maturation protein CgeB